MSSRIDRVLPLRRATHAGFGVAVFVLAIFLATPSGARAEAPQDRMQACLKKAADMPDLAAAEANAWIKQGGGEPALLCRATAQFHRGEFLRSAEDFTQLAGNEKDPRQASFLYQQAGLASTRVNDFKKAEEDYDRALKLEQQDPEIWASRGAMRAAAQRYWEAVDDLNHALAIMPDMMEALRLRGEVWFKLGMDSKAEADFRKVAEMQAKEDVIKTNAPAGKAAPKKP